MCLTWDITSNEVEKNVCFDSVEAFSIHTFCRLVCGAFLRPRHGAQEWCLIEVLLITDCLCETAVPHDRLLIGDSSASSPSAYRRQQCLITVCLWETAVLDRGPPHHRLLMGDSSA